MGLMDVCWIPRVGVKARTVVPSKVNYRAFGFSESPLSFLACGAACYDSRRVADVERVGTN